MVGSNNVLSHEKNQLHGLLVSEDIEVWKILQSHWWWKMLLGKHKRRIFPKYGVGLQQESKNCYNFCLKSFPTNSNIEIISKKPLKSPILTPLYASMGLGFLQVINIYLLAKSQRDRETEIWLDRQKCTVHETAMLHSGPIKQAEIIVVAEETVLIQTLAVLPPTPLIFGIKLFDTEVLAFLSFSPELKFTYKSWVIW